MSLRPIDLVWNRAATEHGGPDARTGDTALAAMLRCHGAVASGGMNFAVVDSLTTDEITSGIEGFQYFGLADAASVFAEALTASDDELERLDARYAAVVLTDDVLVRAFQAKYDTEPDQFAPPGEGA